MDDSEKEMLASYRSEAAAFFAVNQAARTAADRVTALFVSIAAATVVAGISAETTAVVLPLPALSLLLFAYMCNQYSDLTVLGMARREIEERVAAQLGEDVLIYETVVAPVRKHAPLNRGVRLLQASAATLLVAVVVVGTAVAFDQATWLTIAYCTATAAGGATAVAAYRAMLATPRVAAREIAETLARRAAARHSAGS